MNVPRPRISTAHAGLFVLVLSVGGLAQTAPSSPRVVPLGSRTVALEEGRVEVEGRYHLVAFRDALRQEQHAALRAAGVVPQVYVYANTWLCSLAPGALDAGQREPLGILSATPWLPDDKVAPEFRAAEVPDWARTGSGDLRALVSFFPDAQPKDVLATLQAMTTRHEIRRAPDVWAVEIASGMLEALAREPAVLTIHPGPVPFRPTNDESRALLGIDELQQIIPVLTPPVYLGLTGRDVQIAVSESVNTLHPDFYDHDGDGNPIGSRFLNPLAPTPEHPQHIPEHGTHVAGTIGGNGWNSNKIGHIGTPYAWRGMAPECTLIHGYGYGTYRVDASNHSYVMDHGDYGPASENADSDVSGRNGPDRRKPHIWAAANQGLGSFYDNEEGYYSMYAPAKNPTCVGAVATNDASLAVFSSLGPTFDGRIKPDVMAGGTENTRPLDWQDGVPVRVSIDYIRILEPGHSGGPCVDPGTEHCWEFETDGDPEGWFANGIHPNVTDIQVAGGLLSFDVLPGGHGAVTGIGLTAQDDHVIEMRYRVVHPFGTDFTETASFWWTQPGSALWANGLISFDTRMDGQFHVVQVPVGALGADMVNILGEVHPYALGGWKGTIDLLRIHLYKGPRAVRSTWNIGDSYLEQSGTSMATPAVTGTVALLLEQFVRTHGIDLAVDPPLPSTTKALLIETAIDLVHETADPRDPLNPDTNSPVLYGPGPDFATGYGLVDAGAAATLVERAASLDLIHESDLDVGDTDTYLVHVPAGTPRLKLTLAWDDPPAFTSLDQRASRLVNDLDLVLVDPLGRRHRPWRLDPLPVADCGGGGPGPCGDPDPIEPWMVLPAYRGPDGRNNVEQVDVTSPIPGRWKVLVRGLDVRDVSVGPQTYSLVGGLHTERELPAFALSLDASGQALLHLAADGRFSRPVPLPDLGTPAGDFVIGEFTWDGKLDFIVATDEDPARTFLFERTGVRTFSPTELGVLESDPGYADHGSDTGLGLIAADLNADGFTDFLEGVNVELAPGQFWIARGNAHVSNGLGSFAVVPNAFDISSIFSGWAVTLGTSLADVDRDGYVDLLVAEQADGGLTDSGVYLLRGLGDGRFGPPVLVFTTSALPAHSLALGDFDRDGKPDALVGQDDDGDAGSVWFFKGHGDGTFDQVGFEAFDVNPAVEAGFDNPGAGKFQVCDVDGDGLLDVLSAYRRHPTGAELLWLRGHGNGTFGRGRRPVQLASCLPSSPLPCLRSENAFQTAIVSAHDLQIDADLDGDRDVDADDAELVFRNIVLVPAMLLREPKYDLNGDQLVDFADVAYVERRFTD